MIILYILGSLLALILVLLCIPVSVRASYKNTEGEHDITASAHYLFIKYPLYPTPKEKEPENPPEEEPSTKKPKESSYSEVNTPKTENLQESSTNTVTPAENSDTVASEKEEEPKESLKKKLRILEKKAKMVWGLVKGSKGALLLLKRHLIFYKIRGFILVGGSDAHSIGQQYGMHCIAVSNGLGALSQFFKVRKPLLWLQPDFLATESLYDISLRIKICPIFAVGAGILFLIQYLKSQTNTKKVKGGKRNESTKSN